MSSVMNSGYVIERLSESRLADLENLHAAVYGKPPAKGYFRRKYDTRFAGLWHVGFLAYADRVPVAFYGVLPCFIEVAGQQVLAAQSADTMTHPSHRQKGLFVELALRTFELCRDGRIELLFGFPNEHSLPGFLGKLAWQTPTTLDYFRLPVAPSWLGRLAGKLPGAGRLLAGYRSRVLDACRSEPSVLPNSVRSEGFDGVRHDAAWFEYKRYNRTYLIEIAGVVVWVKPGAFLMIGDMEVASETIDAVLDGLKALARKLAWSDIYVYACPGTHLHELLSARHAPTPAFPVIFKRLAGDLPIDRIKFSSADLDIF